MDYMQPKLSKPSEGPEAQLVPPFDTLEPLQD